jgi:toxin ParE1/3/4
MKPVLFHHDAVGEIDDAMAYYESRRTGFGISFLAEVERGIQLIQQHPQRWAVYKNTVFRKYSLRRFPYVIYYFELDHCIWIAAVVHQKRKPGYWSQRRPP